MTTRPTLLPGYYYYHGHKDLIFYPNTQHTITDPCRTGIIHSLSRRSHQSDQVYFLNRTRCRDAMMWLDINRIQSVGAKRDEINCRSFVSSLGLLCSICVSAIKFSLCLFVQRRGAASDWLSFLQRRLSQYNSTWSSNHNIVSGLKIYHQKRTQITPWTS